MSGMSRLFSPPPLLMASLLLTPPLPSQFAHTACNQNIESNPIQACIAPA